MSNTPIKISIIVPIYNVENWLARCLDSLVGQTLRDIEIIAIDDKSPDNSLEIAREYAARDSRIKIIALPQNGGVSAARNAGMKQATGEYLGFVDPDDYVDLDFYEKVYEIAVAANADIAKGNTNVVGLDGKIKTSTVNEKIPANNAFFMHNWWSAIYRRAFIVENKIIFHSDCDSGEDAVFLVETTLSSRIPVAFRDDTFYWYIRVHGSLNANILTPQNFMHRMRVRTRITGFLNTANIDRTTYDIAFNYWFNTEFTHHTRFTKREMMSALAETCIYMYDNYKYAKSEIQWNLKVSKAAKPYVLCNDVDGLTELFVQANLEIALNILGGKPAVAPAPVPVIVPQKKKHRFLPGIFHRKRKSK